MALGGSGKTTAGWSPFFPRPAAVPAFGFGGAITRGQISPEEAAEGASRILQQQQGARKGEPRRLVVDLAAQEDKEKDEPVIVSAQFTVVQHVVCIVANLPSKSYLSCTFTSKRLRDCLLQSATFTQNFRDIQSCAEKRDCFAKHEPGVAGCGWLQAGRNFLSI